MRYIYNIPNGVTSLHARVNPLWEPPAHKQKHIHLPESGTARLHIIVDRNI